MRPIDLAGFEARFAADADPWSTWTDRDEALKRAAILHAFGAGPIGRVWEIGAGNGSNSAAIAPRALRLDATDATGTGTRLVAEAIAPHRPRARALRLAVPAPPPRGRYDAILVAELLYYLDARASRALATQVARRLRSGGRLVLAHHRITFHDFARRAAGIQQVFLRETGARWRVRIVRRTSRWVVLACERR